MERLTERNPSWIDDEMWERACEPDCEEIDAVYRKLKAYEDAEEQGLLLPEPYQGSESHKQTNADKIRAMSDEELAEFIVNLDNHFGEEYEGEQSCLSWLQKESEE